MFYKEIDGEYFFLSDGSWVHEALYDFVYSFKQEVSNDYD
jgi:hypothetical protein